MNEDAPSGNLCASPPKIDPVLGGHTRITQHPSHGRTETGSGTTGRVEEVVGGGGGGVGGGGGRRTRFRVHRRQLLLLGLVMSFSGAGMVLLFQPFRCDDV